MGLEDLLRSLFKKPDRDWRHIDMVPSDDSQEEKQPIFNPSAILGGLFKKWGWSRAEANQEDEDSFQRKYRPQEFPGGFQNHEEMFKNLDQMIRSFEEEFKSMGGDDFPKQPSSEKHPHNWNSLRDFMLKEPEFGLSIKEREENTEEKRPTLFKDLWKEPVWTFPALPKEKVDRDLDEELKDGNLDQFFKGHRMQEPRIGFRSEGPPNGVFKKVQVWTSRAADGKVEERRSHQDGEGNEVTTVTRTIDGQTHAVTVQRDKTGREEKTEKFLNLDERDKDSFDKRWSSPVLPDSKKCLNREMNVRGDQLDNIVDNETRDIFKNLFGLGFPGFGGK